MNISRSGSSFAPYNLPDSIRATLPLRVFFADCTLRDGEQQPGLAFSPEIKLKIARILAELGVDEIEAGTPAVSEDDFAAVATIAGAGLGTRVSALARAMTSDIDRVIATGSWGVRISFPAGMLQLKHKLHLTPDEYVERALSMTEYAKNKGMYVIFSPYDTTRTDEKFLRAVVGTLAHTHTVDRIRLVDTAGIATPHAMRYLVHLIKEESGLPVEVHTHDDLGLAVANAVAAVEAGAEYVSTTLTGLGERSGNAATEQVATVLEVLYGLTTGIRLERLTAAARIVTWLTRTSLAPNTPVVGINSFTHESGLVVGGVLKEPLTAEPFAPELVGQTRRIVVGKKSGTDSIRYLLKELGMKTDDTAVAAILRSVKDRASFLERALTDEEFRTLAISEETKRQ